jgi:hypothetical protein
MHINRVDKTFVIFDLCYNILNWFELFNGLNDTFITFQRFYMHVQQHR